MSDLLFPTFLIPWDIQGLYINSWLIGGPLGQALCKLVVFLINVSNVVSVQSLVLLAVDRFGALVFPLRSPLIRSKLCSFFILATWFIAMAVFSPYLFAFKLVENPEGLVCGLRWKEVFGESSSYSNYFASILMIFCFIPLVFIAVLYIIIYVKLKSQKIPGEQSSNAEQQRRQQSEQNVLKMTIAVVLGFAVCWLPYSIFWFLWFFARDITGSCGFKYFEFFAFLMAYINCAINPCICFIFSRNYRIGLKNLFR